MERLPGAELAAGERLGNYEIIRLVGRGGMGEVYVARDPKLGRRVAIKRVLDADPAFRARFVLEARATARCNHENIVIIHEVNEVDGCPFMVLEYLEGETLAQIRSRGTISPQRAVELMVPVARALAHAHGFGIVHRDLKPENIVLTDAGTVKVLDFGIAKAYVDGSPEIHNRRARRLTMSQRTTDGSTAIGTPPYMSPEQLRGEPLDGRSDVWALGIVLYELIAGHHPLGAQVPRDRYFEIARRTGGLLDDAPPLADAAIQHLVARCLRIDPAERYADANALIAALLATLQGGAEATDDDCPYPGLFAFDAAHAHRFFGRDADIRRARARLRDEPLVALIGPSGAGKSSLLQAGLARSLERAGEDWHVMSLRPGADPVMQLAALAKQLGASAESDAMLGARIRAEPGLLGALLRKSAVEREGRVLLAVDQLEELYTLTEAPEDRNTFTASLLAIADDTESPARVVVTLRSDFLDRASENPAFLDRITRGMVFVAPLDRVGLRDALTRPAELAGYRFESADLVDTMLDALEAATGALPLLQFAASKLWDGRDRERRVLTASSYDEMGGLAGALASHADQVLFELSHAGQADARAMFLRLVTPERTRSIVPLADLVSSARDERQGRELVDRLVGARLLVVRTEGAEPTVEIVHESLITRWPRLAQWLAAAQDDVVFLDQLRTTARQWQDRDRPAGLLWRDSSLEEARSWRARHPSTELPEHERAYLAAVFELADRVRRRRRNTVIGALALMMTIAAAAVIALWLVSRAEHASRVAAEHARDEAQNALEAQEQATREAERAAREAAAAATERDRRQAAETTARTASAKVQETEQDLVKTNERLEAALVDQQRAAARADEARKIAESEAERARKAETALQARRQQLEQLLSEKSQQLRELEQRMSTISTDLH